MRFLLEQIKSSQEWYNSSIDSKFDKWLDYDFGPIRTFAKGLVKDDQFDFPDAYYHETWNFVGRQPDGKYYFRCSDAYDKNMIGQVLAFPRFNDVAYAVALPGRRG